MKQLSCLLLTLMGLVAALLACGGEDSVGQDGLERYFPAALAEPGLEKVSEVRTFVGDSLWEYINGGAELYHSFGFVRVSTADYKNEATEIVLDLYQFESLEGAYGLYASLRPDEPDIVDLGVEGYFTGSSLEFVKGGIMVRLVSYDATDATEAALRGLAARVATALPGGTTKPMLFGLFPEGGRVPFTDKIAGEAFLGHGFLNMVYQQDYGTGDDRATLFVMSDADGSAMAQWYEQIAESERSPAALAELPFDEGHCLLVAHSFYGNIIAGLKNGILVGMVNYTDQHREFVSDWLESLPAAP